MYGGDGLCQCEHLVNAHIDACHLQHSLQFLVDFQCYETDAHVSFYASARKMEHVAYLYL